MANGAYLTNQLLIAMPALADPNFAQTVTLVCEHSERGALGLVLNRPMEMRLGEVLEQLSLSTDDVALRDQPVLRGGPVQVERGFVLHRPMPQPYESTLEVSDALHVTTSRDVLGALATGTGPDQVCVALGYAGWEAGQLEAEMLQNAWLTVPCSEQIVFDLPYEDRWQAAVQLLGIDVSRLSHIAGRA